jgi:hypothetical protein
MENTLQDEIAKVAHDLYEKSGRIAGRDTLNWLEAEKIVLARRGKGADKAKQKNPPKTPAPARK